MGLMVYVQFEEQLRNTDDSTSGPQEQAKARAVMLYYCSRMLTVRFNQSD